MDSSDLAEIDPRDLDNTDLKINNKYAPLIVNLPMHIDSENLHIEEEKFVHAFTNRIRAVNRERRDLRNMTEYSVSCILFIFIDDIINAKILVLDVALLY